MRGWGNQVESESHKVATKVTLAAESYQKVRRGRIGTDGILGYSVRKAAAVSCSWSLFTKV